MADGKVTGWTAAGKGLWPVATDSAASIAGKHIGAAAPNETAAELPRRAISCNQSGVLRVYAMGKSRTREAPRPRIPRSDCPKAARTCLCVRAALFARCGYSPQYRRGAAYCSANRAGSASPVLTQPGIPEYRLEALAVESKLHDKPFTGWPKSGARGALQCVIFVTNLKIAIANDTFLSSFCPDSRAGTQSSRTKGSESPTTLGKRRRGGDGR
jgi:hypothetical protein